MQSTLQGLPFGINLVSDAGILSTQGLCFVFHCSVIRLVLFVVLEIWRWRCLHIVFPVVWLRGCVGRGCRDATDASPDQRP